MRIEVCGPCCSSAGRRAVGRVVFRNGGPPQSVFDYTEHLETLVRRWCERFPQLRHVDMDRVVFSVARCRSRSRKGLYASVCSLKFPGGKAGGGGRRVYRLPQVRKNGRDALYLIKFYLPRFHNLGFEDKVSTILHELFHIHPKFNGEFRMFEGRHWAHGRSEKDFERMFACLKRDILKKPDPLCELFLNCRFQALLRRFGDVCGDRVSFSWAEEKGTLLT
ncbi:MAG: putative metallopeptidase [Planctomycetota bacterium]|jgi:predicted metallopeptidase